MFNQYFLDVVTKKYADFNGRARRSEFWYFLLFVIVGIFALSLILGFISSTLAAIVTGIFYLGMFIPYLACLIRRMHDVGKSGWYCLIPIYSIILIFTDSQPGSNEYGPNPKGTGNNANDDQLINSIGK
jgi:uncharacterized membrane protein YhaH (DUF805 family)